MARNTNLSCVFLLVCLCITYILAIPPRNRNKQSRLKQPTCPVGWEVHRSRPGVCIWLSHASDSWMSAGIGTGKQLSSCIPYDIFPIPFETKPKAVPFDALGKNRFSIYVNDIDQGQLNENWCILFGGKLSVVNQGDVPELVRMIGAKKFRKEPVGKFWTDAVVATDSSGFKSMYSKRVPFVPHLLKRQLPRPYDPYFPFPVHSSPTYDKNCLAIDEVGRFLRESCNSDHQFICEKELFKKPSQPQNQVY